jgi:GNAT superfamily N-acetyltransferase
MDDPIKLRKPLPGERFLMATLATFSGITPSAGDLTTVATINNEPVAGLWQGENHGGWAFDIAVSPPWRRKGIATRLAGLALQEAKKRGLKPTPLPATEAGTALLKNLSKRPKRPQPHNPKTQGPQGP